MRRAEIEKPAVTCFDCTVLLLHCLVHPLLCTFVHTCLIADETCRDREAGRHVLRLYCFVVALSCSPHLRFVKMLYTVQLFSSGADYVSIGLTREYWRRAEGTTPVGGSWADTHTVKALTTL